MDINTFNNIISNQTEISFDVARKQIKKVTKICGFLNLRGYESLETPVKPVQVRGEIRLIEPNDTYSVYLKRTRMVTYHIQNTVNGSVNITNT